MDFMQWDIVELSDKSSKKFLRLYFLIDRSFTQAW
ncbi:hypothetical protein BCEN4_850008 [Burkholderia cenocepacia]|nr:hypothetical protein BCEN4_850008 [Burkholderia cenocepacia]